MKKILAFLLVIPMMLMLSGCALFEFIHDKDDIVDLGDGKNYVRWNLVSNDNAYRAVETAYFEFNEDSFRYYENGVLKKEGSHRITYFGVENTINPLNINLMLGDDVNGKSMIDSLQCYTEDAKEGLRQFTVMSEGYHVDAARPGGVPIRDYHLSDMPYAFGTYVKEGSEQYTYKNGKANYLKCANLDGTFTDEAGNKFYFANNSYSSDPQSSSYTVYMRYENSEKGKFVEGTIRMSYYEDFLTKEPHNVALVYITHGSGEPSEESGMSVDADFEFIDFDFIDASTFSLAGAKYFAESTECDYDPQDFIAGTYRKVA